MIDRELLNIIFKERPQNKKWAGLLQDEPTPSLPIVSKSDIDRKFLDRYFVRSVSDKNLVVEVDQLQYEKFKENPRFVTTRLKWKIVGKKETETTDFGAVNPGVEDYNKEQVSKADVIFKTLHRYITNYTEYWVAENIAIKNTGSKERT